MNLVLLEKGAQDDEKGGDVHADVEKEPQLPVGVSIKGLRKVFEVRNVHLRWFHWKRRSNQNFLRLGPVHNYVMSIAKMQ